jgi:hypothetical protein
MRWFAVFVGLWGAYWIIYVWFTYSAYAALDVIFGPSPSSEFAEQVAATRVNLKVAIGLFVASAFVAIGSAIGLFLGRSSAKRVWLSWCVVLLLIYLVLVYADPSQWDDHLELLFLAPASWLALRDAERKTHVEP